jgi:hypothetical protein
MPLARFIRSNLRVGKMTLLSDTFAPLSTTLRCQIAATLCGVRIRSRKDNGKVFI